jgi:hypothetical protein
MVEPARLDNASLGDLCKNWLDPFKENSASLDGGRGLTFKPIFQINTDEVELRQAV